MSAWVKAFVHTLLSRMSPMVLKAAIAVQSPSIITYFSSPYKFGESAIWLTPHVQNNIFTGCLDPENVWLAIRIAFLSALHPKLQATMFNSAATLSSNVSDTGSSNNDFTGFLDPKDMGVGTEITFLCTLVSKL